ncbi:hypothetical protein ACF0H5_013186 [Mactra antiquata]
MDCYGCQVDHPSQVQHVLGCDLNEVIKTRFKMDFDSNDTQILYWFAQHYGIYYRQAQKGNKIGQKCCSGLGDDQDDLFNYLIVSKHRSFYGI